MRTVFGCFAKKKNFCVLFLIGYYRNRILTCSMIGIQLIDMSNAEKSTTSCHTFNCKAPQFSIHFWFLSLTLSLSALLHSTHCVHHIVSSHVYFCIRMYGAVNGCSFRSFLLFFIVFDSVIPCIESTLALKLLMDFPISSIHGLLRQLPHIKLISDVVVNISLNRLAGNQ